MSSNLVFIFYLKTFHFGYLTTLRQKKAEGFWISRQRRLRSIIEIIFAQGSQQWAASHFALTTGFLEQ